MGTSLNVFLHARSSIAIELTGKFNSVLWCWKGKGTLSIGSINGAMDVVYVALISLYPPPIAR